MARYCIGAGVLLLGIVITSIAEEVKKDKKAKHINKLQQRADVGAGHSIIFQMFMPKHDICSAYLHFTRQLNTTECSEQNKIISTVKVHIVPAVQ